MRPAVPATMTAIEIREAGGPEVLVPASRPVPEPGTGEVLMAGVSSGIRSAAI